MTLGTVKGLYAHFVSRTDRMISRYNSTTPAVLGQGSMCTKVRRESRLFCVIRLQHLWGAFCRELLVRSSVGGSSTIGGTYLTPVPGIVYPNDVDKVAQQTLRRQRIAWHVPILVGRVVRQISPANEMQIVTALSSVSPVDDILKVRNHLVHPSAETQRLYSVVTRRLGIFDSDPEVLLSASISPGNVTRFEYWVIQLQAVALDASR